MVEYHNSLLPKGMGFDFVNNMKQNPFGLYCSFLEMKKPIAYVIRQAKHKTEVMKLKNQIDILREEASSRQKLAEMFLDLENDYNSRIKDLDS
jgi:hypothetical protein